jgi:hypothetical protein
MAWLHMCFFDQLGQSTACRKEDLDGKAGVFIPLRRLKEVTVEDFVIAVKCVVVMSDGVA